MTSKNSISFHWKVCGKRKTCVQNVNFNVKTRSHAKDVSALWAQICGMLRVTVGSICPIYFFSWNVVAVKSQKMPNHTNTWNHQTPMITQNKFGKCPTAKTETCAKDDASRNIPSSTRLAGNKDVFSCKRQLFCYRPTSGRTRRQICEQICLQTLLSCLQPGWTLHFTI